MRFILLCDYCYVIIYCFDFSVTEDFMDCLYESCKKIEENYIKVEIQLHMWFNFRLKWTWLIDAKKIILGKNFHIIH